jgi:hypothetical protein
MKQQLILTLPFALISGPSGATEPEDASAVRATEQAQAQLSTLLTPPSTDCLSTTLPSRGQSAPRADECAFLRRDEKLGFVPSNWGLTFSGSDLMAAMPEVISASEAGNPRPRACVIDTGLRLRNTPGAGNDLQAQETGLDDSNHGTHVAGIVSSRDFGVNPHLSTRVLSAPTRDPKEITAALLLAADDPSIQVINLSWAIREDSEVISAIQKAVAAGKWISIAAGNSGLVNDPESKGLAQVEDLPGVFIVGSESPFGAPSSFSNHGPTVDFYAPGSQIDSLNGKADPGFLGAPGDLHESGTSMAAPHATAVLTTLRALDPNLKFEEAQFLIQDTALRAGPPPGIARLNESLAAAVLIRMRALCPRLRKIPNPSQEFHSCAARAKTTLQQELRTVENGSQTSSCADQEKTYQQLRRNFFLSQGSSAHADTLRKFLEPTTSATLPALAESFWFVANTTSASELGARVGNTPFPTGFTDDAKAAARFLQRGEPLPPGTEPTISERLKQLPARRESVSEFVQICTPRTDLDQYQKRAADSACTAFMAAAPQEFQEALVLELKNQVAAARNSGKEPALLARIRTSEEWLDWLSKTPVLEDQALHIIATYIVSQPTSPGDRSLAQVFRGRVAEATFTPAVGASPELNRAILGLSAVGSASLKPAATPLDSFRNVLDICRRAGGECKKAVTISSPAASGSTEYQANINLGLYQTALLKEFQEHPDVALDIARHLQKNSADFDVFLQLFGTNSWLTQGLIKALPASEAPLIQDLLRTWIEKAQGAIILGTACPKEAFLCDPSTDLADQLEAIATTSSIHLHAVRATLAATQPQGKLAIQLSANTDLLFPQEQDRQVQLFLARHSGPNATAISARTLFTDAGKLIDHPQVRALYLSKLSSELTEMSRRGPVTDAEKELPILIQNAPPETRMLAVQAVLHQAQEGAPLYPSGFSNTFNAWAKSEADNPHFLDEWSSTLKEEIKNRTPKSPIGHQELIAYQIAALAETSHGQELLRATPELIASFVETYQIPGNFIYASSLAGNRIPPQLSRAILAKLPPPETLSGMDLQAPENQWILRYLRDGVDQRETLDYAIRAYRSAKDPELQTTLRYAVSAGLDKNPLQFSELAQSGGLLTLDSELRALVWGEPFRDWGTQP